MDFFSSRELAIGFWLIVGLAYFTYSKKFRPYLKQLVSCFCNVYILIPVFGLGLYIVALSYFLIEINFWNFNQYKNVMLWFVFVGIYSLFQVANVNKGSKYFKDAVVDLFKITTVFEFVVVFYSFNFWFELVFIPFITIVMLVSAFSENNEEHKIVFDFLGRFIAAIGLCIILYVIYLVFSDPDEFFSVGTAYDFFVPILMTIGIFPYLYMMLLYVEYERFFRRLHLNFKDDDLEKYAKRKAILYFNFRLSFLKRWDRYLSLHDVDSEYDIEESIKRIRFLIKRDKNNIPVKFEMGWSHYEARRYLKGYGLITSYYDHLYHEKWSANSESLKLGEGIFCNKITYHIDGNEEAVKCLTLVLDVNETELFEEAFNKFKEIGNYLFEKSVSDNKELTIKTEEVEGEEEEVYQTHMTKIDERHIMIQKRKHLNLDTFELRLSFAVDKESFKYADTI